MLIPNHPADERLAAFADNDPEATEPAIAEHVASCARCTATVDELAGLRVALASMPDIAPSRPLQLVPPVAPAPDADRVGGWVRRLFGPVLAAGAAVALVGAVGTTAPLLDGLASGGQDSSGLTPMQAAPSAGGAPADGAGVEEMAPGASDARAAGASADPEPEAQATDAEEDGGTALLEGSGDQGALASRLAMDRSPWPMVLFAGIALVIAALLLRWILAPRAG
ncbi:MAG: hypothetical protein K5924_09365 [Chloroflexi bacterium]|nr:hypothetical protein [Chloroflexota bacterium]